MNPKIEADHLDRFGNECDNILKSKDLRQEEIFLINKKTVFSTSL